MNEMTHYNKSALEHGIMLTPEQMPSSRDFEQLRISKMGDSVSVYKAGETFTSNTIAHPGDLVVGNDWGCNASEMEQHFVCLFVKQGRICWSPSKEDCDENNATIHSWIPPNRNPKGPFCASTDGVTPDARFTWSSVFNPSGKCGGNFCPLARSGNKKDRGGVTSLRVPTYDPVTKEKTGETEEILSGCLLKCSSQWHLYGLIYGYDKVVKLVLERSNWMLGKDAVKVMTAAINRGKPIYSVTFGIKTRLQQRGNRKWWTFEQFKTMPTNLSNEENVAKLENLIGEIRGQISVALEKAKAPVEEEVDTDVSEEETPF